MPDNNNIHFKISTLIISIIKCTAANTTGFAVLANEAHTVVL